MSKTVNGLIAQISSPNTASKSASSINSSKSMEQTLMDESRNLTRIAFDFNRTEAQKERDWSEYMSNTSHQREVQDLISAGLNPVLSANSGANSYSGASASGSADNSAIGAISSIYQTKMANQNAMKIAQMNNKTAIANKKMDLKIAEIGAAAQRYASDNSYSASRYASDLGYSSSLYGTDHSKYGMIDKFIGSLLEDKHGSGVNGVASRVNKIVHDAINEAKDTNTYKRFSEAYTRHIHNYRYNSVH